MAATEVRVSGTRLIPAPFGQSGKLKVTIVAESFLPHINGVTNSVLRVIEFLQSNGHEVTVIAPGPGDSQAGTIPVIRMQSFGFPGYKELRIARPQRALEDALRLSNPDVIHVAAPAVLGAWAIHIARKLDIPTVAIYQTDLAGFARQYRLRMTSPALSRYVAAIHQRADLTLAPSTAAVWELRKNGVDNVYRWMRGVDTIRFSPAHRNELLRKQFGSPNKVIVGFVGRLAREKQVERLVEVAAMSNVTAVIVGDGPCRAKLQQLMPSAHFTGFLGGLELSEMYASFDIFAHTGVNETFCQAVQESLSSGVPVVAPAAGGPLDTVQHGLNGYLWDPKRSGNFAQCVAELVDSDALRIKLAAQARDTVIHRTWPSVMQELLGHYESVINRRAFTQSALAV